MSLELRALSFEPAGACTDLVPSGLVPEVTAAGLDASNSKLQALSFKLGAEGAEGAA